MHALLGIRSLEQSNTWDNKSKKELPELHQAAIMIKMNKEEAENIIRDIVHQHIFDLIDIDGECEDREDIEKALEILTGN